MARLFGTDGVRGVANVDLTCELSYRLGQAAASFMGKTIVVGKDTRKSGDMLEAAVVAGITSAGGDALLTGVIPTPAVALLVRELHADGGIVISASHNPCLLYTSCYASMSFSSWSAMASMSAFVAMSGGRKRSVWAPV